MAKGIRVVISIIALTLIIIAERGAPVKFKKWDTLTYAVTFIVLLMITGSF